MQRQNISIMQVEELQKIIDRSSVPVMAETVTNAVDNSCFFSFIQLCQETLVEEKN